MAIVQLVRPGTSQVINVEDTQVQPYLDQGWVYSVPQPVEGVFDDAVRDLIVDPDSVTAKALAVKIGAGGGGGGSTDFTGDTLADPFLTTKVDGDTAPRFAVRADGAAHFSDGINAPNRRGVGWFFERRELYDFGTGEPFSQGHYDFLVIGNPDDPLGDNFESASGQGGTGPTAEHGYNLKVHGFAQINNSLSVFSRTQPYIVVGRWGIDNRYPTLRPEGYGEEAALGVAATDTDYYSDIKPGDVALRAYGDGPGSNRRHRRVLLGSNTGAVANHSTMSVGVDSVRMHRPIDFTNPLVADPATGKVYLLINGKRYEAFTATVASLQVSDSFTESFLVADTGQPWFTAIGRFLSGSGVAHAANLNSSGFALALQTAPADNYTVACDVIPGSFHAAWLAVRVTDGQGNNLIVASVNTTNGDVALQKKVGGTFSSLASAPGAASSLWPTDARRRLSVQVAGNTITVRIGTTQVLTHTLDSGDAAIFGNARNAGLMPFDVTTNHDDFTLTI